MGAIIAYAALPPQARIEDADTDRLPTVAYPADIVWGAELHPWWCGERYAAGCGTHLSGLNGVQATADPADVRDNEVPLVSVAAFMAADGSQGVHLHMLQPSARGGEAWATFTVEQWRAIVALGAEALAMIASEPKMATLPPRPGSEPVKPLEGEALTEHLRQIRAEWDAEDAGTDGVA